jgi:hypothetical protein
VIDDSTVGEVGALAGGLPRRGARPRRVPVCEGATETQWRAREGSSGFDEGEEAVNPCVRPFTLSCPRVFTRSRWLRSSISCFFSISGNSMFIWIQCESNLDPLLRKGTSIILIYIIKKIILIYFLRSELLFILVFLVHNFFYLFYFLS